jgi:hypothetical protein
MEEPRRIDECNGVPRFKSPLPGKALFWNITRPRQMNAFVVGELTKNRASIERSFAVAPSAAYWYSEKI